AAGIDPRRDWHTPIRRTVRLRNHQRAQRFECGALVRVKERVRRDVVNPVQHDAARRFVPVMALAQDIRVGIAVAQRHSNGLRRARRPSAAMKPSNPTDESSSGANNGGPSVKLNCMLRNPPGMRWMPCRWRPNPSNPSMNVIAEVSGSTYSATVWL